MLNEQVKNRLLEITKELKELSIENKTSLYINANPYTNDGSTISVFCVEGYVLGRSFEWVEVGEEKTPEFELTIYDMKEVAAV